MGAFRQPIIFSGHYPQKGPFPQGDGEKALLSGISVWMEENLAYAGKDPMRVPCCCYLKGNARQGVTDGAMVPRRLEKPHAYGWGGAKVRMEDSSGVKPPFMCARKMPASPRLMRSGKTHSCK